MITGLIVIFKILFISLIGFHFIHKPHQAKNRNSEGPDQGQVANSHTTPVIAYPIHHNP